MTAERTLPYFNKTIVPTLKEGKNVFVCAHGNSLRSILMELDHLSPDEVVKLEVATGEPIIYTFNNDSFTKQE
jgi:2,3-bisphosphoglycerate-dependent phosphoglycerate mutase